MFSWLVFELFWWFWAIGAVFHFRFFFRFDCVFFYFCFIFFFIFFLFFFVFFISIIAIKCCLWPNSFFFHALLFWIFVCFSFKKSFTCYGITRNIGFNMFTDFFWRASCHWLKLNWNLHSFLVASQKCLDRVLGNNSSSSTMIKAVNLAKFHIHCVVSNSFSVAINSWFNSVNARSLNLM